MSPDKKMDWKRQCGRFLRNGMLFALIAVLLIGCGKKEKKAEDELIEEEEVSDVVATLDGYGSSSEEEDEIAAEDAGDDGTLQVITAEAIKDPYLEVIERAQQKGLPAPPNIDVTGWQYILASESHPLPDGYKPPEISHVGRREIPMDSRVADKLYEFAVDCQKAGNEVYLSSGYRAYSEQESLFKAKVREYGEEEAAKIVLPPGTSEHQTGLCCDITDIYRSPKSPSVLSKTETFLWLNEHCEQYGFILRYPEDKQEITNIIYEPWHFRYVGEEVAKYIKENNLCLEEFLELYGVE